jgi:hypothetical protein
VPTNVKNPNGSVQQAEKDSIAADNKFFSLENANENAVAIFCFALDMQNSAAPLALSSSLPWRQNER